jgi:LysW-gamma-L-lysine carboxypeptidase
MGHIDTVPGGPKVAIEPDRIQGRGSVDAKGACCAMLAAGGAIPVMSGWRVTFVGAVGEEEDSRGSRFRMPLHSPAACVIGEPTGSDGIALSYRGRVYFTFEASDLGAHRSGSPGPMTDVVSATASLVNVTKNMQGYTTSVVQLDGREAGTRYGRIAIDLRIPEGAVQEEVELMLSETAAAFGVKLNVIEYVPPYGVPKTDKVIRAFIAAIRDIGVKPRVLAKQGTCDFNVLSPWACPMGAYGPGDSRYDHASDEQISVAEFMRAIDVLKLALPRIMESL